MEFIYGIDGHGWAKGYIEIKGKKFEFVCSYTTKGISELLERLLLLITNAQKSEMNPNPMYWDEEPNETAWTLEKLGEDELLVSIEYIKSIFTDDEWQIERNTLLRETVSLSKFAEIVVKQANNLLNNHGIIGFRNAWGEEFPLSHFLQLKQILLNCPIPIEINHKQGIYKSDIKSEINSFK